MRVLVTGASGWIGAAVVPELAAGHELRCLDVVPAAAGAPGEWLEGDLSDYTVCRRATAGMDAVVHLAAGHWRDAEAPPGDALTPSVVATASLLAAATAAGVRRFVLMSSCAVVTGYPRPSAITADLPHRFDDLYGLAKSLQEHVTAFYARGALAAIALRPWSVVDARARRWKDGRPLLRSDELWTHDGHFGLIDRGDVARATRAALTAEVAGFQALHLIATREGRECFDAERTERVLGWRPELDFAELAPLA